MRRLAVSVLFLVLLAPAVGGAQQEEARRLDVVDVSGPLDDQVVAFAIDTIREAAERDSEAVIIQLDSPGVVADRDRYEELVALVADPPLPLAVWVGPAPAVAYGGAADLVVSAPLRMAAPGARIGLAEPTIAADPGDTETRVPLALTESFLEVEGPVHEVVDVVSPAIRQLIQDLDGVAVQVGGEPRELSTLTTVEVDGRSEVSTIEVVFHEPGYWAAFLRLGVTPEAAFLFLVAGLTVAAFEFYAIGPGLAAGVAAISLFLASYGMFALPLRWWAVGLAVAGWALLTASYQRGGVATLTGLGAVAMLGGGLWYVDGAPQLEVNPIVIVVIVASVLLFYTVAMPTVARSRFSTRTIGRDHLVGERGRAVTDFDPDGEVEVSGARWTATAHREAGIRAGDVVRIAGVDGSVLEVDPLPEGP